MKWFAAMMMALMVLMVLMVGCEVGTPDPSADAGADAEPDCYIDPILAQIGGAPCAADSDCAVAFECVNSVCIDGKCSLSGQPNGTVCELDGYCDDRRCCHNP